jgi:hypothetical protein
MQSMFSSPLLPHTFSRRQPASASSGKRRPARLAPKVNQTRLSGVRQWDLILIREGIARALPFDFNNRKLRQMAGFARCSRGNHVLTSVHVEAVPAFGALPAASKVLVVACSNCRAPLGTSIVGARTDTRSQFHGASVAMTHPGRRQSVGATIRRLLENEGR